MLRNFVAAILLLTSCVGKPNKEGFSDIGKVDYKYKTRQISEYPAAIDNKIKWAFNPNFSDSVRELKQVWLNLKIYTSNETNKIDHIDTGYTVIVKDDLKELIWEVNLDSKFKIEASEEMTFKFMDKLNREGEKLRH